MTAELRPREELRKRREALCLTLRQAGALANVNYKTIDNWERGVGRCLISARAGIIRLCRGYSRRAEELGYDVAYFHESQACPDEGFLSPTQQVAGDA